MDGSINVIGLGYIGLPTAYIIANRGFDVIGTDINADLVEKLKNDLFVTDEPELSELIKSVNDRDKIAFRDSCVVADIYIASRILLLPWPFSPTK